MQVVRTAAVTDDASRATLTVRLWPSHPAVLVDRTMGEIGARAARGQPLTPAILNQVEQIASKAPLAPEPFLIKGALAQVEQRQEYAEQLFTAAHARDPRSVAARYFLADRYVRSGRTARPWPKSPHCPNCFPKAWSGSGQPWRNFAQTAGAVPQLRRLFQSSPQLEPVVLSALANDARNAKLVLALWGRRQGSADPATAEWQAKLVGKLVEQGQFGSAYAIWRLVAGVGEVGGNCSIPAS